MAFSKLSGWKDLKTWNTFKSLISTKYQWQTSKNNRFLELSNKSLRNRPIIFQRDWKNKIMVALRSHYICLSLRFTKRWSLKDSHQIRKNRFLKFKIFISMVWKILFFVQMISMWTKSTKNKKRRSKWLASKTPISTPNSWSLELYIKKSLFGSFTSILITSIQTGSSWNWTPRNNFLWKLDQFSKSAHRTNSWSRDLTLVS